MKKILIAGGAGFLGVNLTRKLISIENVEIIILDNFYTGKLNNLDFFKENQNIKIINHDICDPIDIAVDEIYNLACPASPIHYQFDPIKTTKTSVLGSINLLELSKKNKCKIFQASTSEVYGDPEKHPQSEEYWGHVNPIGIRSCYDVGKRCAESLFYDYMRMFNLKIKICRIFNTYGPFMREDDGRVISNFINQALRNEDITIYGDGKQTRSFCYVDDLIEGFIKLMQSDETVIGPINLGNSNEYSMIEIAQIILKLTNSKSKLVYKELPSDDPKVRCPDLTKAKNLLNWEPKYDLSTGLTFTINYFRNKMNK